jgi:pimeloyl-ACP methyl ester carboxylesterase
LVITAGLGGGVRAWSAIVARLMNHFRIFAWDYRGLYASASDPPPAAGRLTIANHANDLIDLVDHLALRRDRHPILAGWSMGVQVTFEATRTRPNLGKAIVALHGAPGGILSTAFNSQTFERLAPHIFSAMKKHHGLFRGPAHHLARSRRVAMRFMTVCQDLGFMDSRLDPDVFHDMARDWVRLDLNTYATIFEHLGDHDARDILPAVSMPALVVAGDKDVFTPVVLSEEIVSLVPDSQLLIVPEATHFGPLEHPDAIANAILAFAMSRELLNF